jgi:uncharacterized protein YggU (UPF0235/DUF167 family)
LGDEIMDKKREFNLHDGKFGAAIAVRVIPRASQNEVSEILDDGTVKIHLKAAHSGGKADQELLDFLSQVLEVPKTKLEIVAGEGDHDKLITICDLDTETVQKRILKKIK